MLVRKKATLEQIEGKNAILGLENGDKIKILREELSPSLEIGEKFVLQILPEAEAALEKEDLARVLLEQLLNLEDQES
jgi:hypothetical protein